MGAGPGSAGLRPLLGGSLGVFRVPPWAKLRKRRTSSERARGPPETLLTLSLTPLPLSLSPSLAHQGRQICAATARPEAHCRPQRVPSPPGGWCAGKRRRQAQGHRPRATGQGQSVRPGPAAEVELPAETRAALPAMDVPAQAREGTPSPAGTPSPRARGEEARSERRGRGLRKQRRRDVSEAGEASREPAAGPRPTPDEARRPEAAVLEPKRGVGEPGSVHTCGVAGTRKGPAPTP